MSELERVWIKCLLEIQTKRDEIIAGAFYSHFHLSLNHPERLTAPDTLLREYKGTEEGATKYEYSYRGEVFLIERERQEIGGWNIENGSIDVKQISTFEKK